MDKVQLNQEPVENIQGQGSSTKKEAQPEVEKPPAKRKGRPKKLESEGKARETLNWEPADAIRYAGLRR